MSIHFLPSTSDDFLLDALPAADLLKYSRTSKSAHSIVKGYMARVFRVDALLSRYFQTQEVARFRELQFLTGTLISGSTALQFFDREAYPESDLDLYTEHKCCRSLAQWLLEIGYKYAPLPESPKVDSLDKAFAQNPPEKEYSPSFIAQQTLSTTDYNRSLFTFNFEKHNPYRKIQLITSLTTPMQRILQFHSTCVMNIISYEKAYALFPRATLQERRSLLCYDDKNEFRDKAIKKYTDRGWSFIRASGLELEERKALSSSFAFGNRYVGDRSCWTLPLHPPVHLPQGYVETNSWTASLGNRKHPVMIYAPIAEKKLKFSYILNFSEYSDIKAYIRGRVRMLEESDGPHSKIMLDDALRLATIAYRNDVEEEIESMNAG